MRRKVAVADERTDPEAAVNLLDLAERQSADVDESVRRLDLELHQVEQVGAAGDKAGAAARGLARIGGVGSALILECPHRVCAPATSTIASTMLG